MPTCRIAFLACAVPFMLAMPGAGHADQQLVIAPHLSGVAFCPAAASDASVTTQEQAAAFCAARNENAAPRITALLDAIGPKVSPSGHYALGYTLSLPLLGFYDKLPSGAWALDHQAISAAVRTIHDVDRPVVVYLSANHFTDGGIKLSDELAKDPANLMWTRHGPLKADGYFVVGVHAWTLADPQAPITRMRKAAFGAVVDELCRLDTTSRARIAGVSVLGEVHQLFPNFAQGEGYDAGFEITDYAPKSVAGFHTFLATRFSGIAALNAWAGSQFRNFDDVAPPSKDIRHETLANFYEHIDAFAAGTVAIQGWAFDPAGGTPHLSIYLDGIFRATVLANLNRTDVPEANRSVTQPNVGWRYDLDYRRLPPGVHTLEVFLNQGSQRIRMVRQGLTIVARDQRPSLPVPTASVSAALPGPDMKVLVNIDGPPPMIPLFYNPIADVWLQYRNKQVADYIADFAGIVDGSCLPHGVAYAHQIMPHLNSSWDADLLAVDASELPNQAYQPGTTLYGGAAFGDAFFDWMKAEGWHGYGVSEMHPRFALTEPQLLAMLEAHRLHGARFIAPYYMSITPARVAPPAGHGLTRMLIAPDNPSLGSDIFYQAISDAVRNH